jgi:acetamidase/formamidase
LSSLQLYLYPPALQCLTAVEAALTGPSEFHVRSDPHLMSLRAETPGAWIAMRFDEDLDVAAKAALRDMIELIRERGKAVRSRPMKSPDSTAASREANN